MQAITAEELLSTVFEPTGVSWVDEGRSCEHDVYYRLWAQDPDATTWNGKNLDARYCREHKRWIEVPRDFHFPNLPHTTRHERELSGSRT